MVGGGGGGGVLRAAIKGQESNEVTYACYMYIMVNRSLQV